MLSDSFLEGFTSLYYSSDPNPLEDWKLNVRKGHIKQVQDDEVNVNILEIVGNNVATTYIATPPDPNESLSIQLPILVLIVKNLNKYFTFEVKILDDSGTQRKIKIINWKMLPKIKNDFAVIPVEMCPGWNQIQFNLADFVKKIYGTNYLQVVRIHIHANVGLRQLYFTDKVYTEEELKSQKICQNSLIRLRKAELLAKTSPSSVTEKACTSTYRTE